MRAVRREKECGENTVTSTPPSKQREQTFTDHADRSGNDGRAK